MMNSCEWSNTLKGLEKISDNPKNFCWKTMIVARAGTSVVSIDMSLIWVQKVVFLVFIWMSLMSYHWRGLKWIYEFSFICEWYGPINPTSPEPSLVQPTSSTNPTTSLLPPPGDKYSTPKSKVRYYFPIPPRTWFSP